jgi:type II secretory pathway component PulJ
MGWAVVSAEALAAVAIFAILALRSADPLREAWRAHRRQAAPLDGTQPC